MQILYFFERLRQPWLDRLMLLFTQFGGEILFMALAIGMYWCCSKRTGYYMLTVGFIGTIFNQFLKLVFRISRPWVQDPNFTIVEAARADAGGYSFPSGHTQNAASTLLSPALVTKHKGVKIALWAIYFLVAISRMYLGVHTPLDVGVSLIVGLALVFALRPVFAGEETPPRRMYILFAAMLCLAALYTVYVEAWPFPADIEAENLAEGTKNAYTLLGAVAGMLTAYWLDQRYVHFTVRGSLPAQAVKLAVGLALTIGLRVALKKPLNTLLNGAAVADAIRYFVMVVFAAGIWPMTFPWICKKLPAKGTASHIPA